MVKPINLTQLGVLKSELLTIVSKKIAAGKTSLINQDLNDKLKIDKKILSEILDSIETKIRECEMIFHTYLEFPNHDVLSGRLASLPIVLNLEFTYDTNILKKSIEINDKPLYKEIVDMNFRHFILLIASIYENIVFLSELLMKKIILYLPHKRPPSEPLHDFVSFLKALIKLGYRKDDEINKCILIYNSFFEKYLLTINYLRNRFMHGFTDNLASDNSVYKIVSFLPPFTKNSAELEIDFFSDKVLAESKTFVSAIIIALTKSIKHSSKSIPA